MVTFRRDHTATFLPDGRVLIVGGYTGDIHSNSLTASAEIYDPASGTFTALGDCQSHNSAEFCDFPPSAEREDDPVCRADCGDIVTPESQRRLWAGIGRGAVGVCALWRNCHRTTIGPPEDFDFFSSSGFDPVRLRSRLRFFRDLDVSDPEGWRFEPVC